MKWKVAKNPGHYAEAHKLLREANFPKQVLGFPTVMAYNDENELIGFMSTHIVRRMVIAGPLVLKPSDGEFGVIAQRMHLAVKLMEAYETAMRSIGLTSFIFSAEVDSASDQAAQRYNYGEPYAVEDGRRFYVRKIGNGKQSLRPRSVTGREGSAAEPSGPSSPSTLDN